MHLTTKATTAAAAVLALAMGVAGCGGSGSSANSTGLNSGTHKITSSVAGKKVAFIVYATPSTPFFVPVINGAKDAAKAYGLSLNVEYSNSDVATQNNQLQTALASGADAIAVSIPDNTSMTKSVCAANDKKIPVVAFNVTATSGPVLGCTLSFVGQDFEAAGYQIAEQMIKAGKIKNGAHVFCPVEQATAVYATERAAGADKALASVGAKCDVVNTGFDLPKAQTTEQQYLLSHQDTGAILALGQVPLQVAPAAAKSAGLDSATIGGFDLSDSIAKDIQSGAIFGTVEQQPYEQGYYAVMQLALRLQYGLQPSDINTGNLIVDKSNVANVADLAGKVY